MCFQGRSRFCLICLLLYTWLPSGIQVAATVKEAEKTTYPSLNKTTIDPQTDHDHEVYQVTEVMPEMIDKRFYMSKLMEEYGNGTMMTFEGFEHLLQKLGLGKIVVFDHPVKCHKLQNGSNFQAFHKTHNHSYVIPGSENSNILCEDINNDVDTDHDDEAHEHGDEQTHDHIDEQTHTHIDELTHDHIDEQTHDQIDEHIHEDNHTHEEVNKLSEDIVNNEPPTKDSEDGSEKLSSHSKRDIPIKEKCLSAITFLNMGKGKDLRHLSAETFQDLCPSLVYHISQDTCHDHHVDFPHSIHSSNQVTDHDNHDDHHEHVNAGREGGLSSNSAKVWGYSTIAIVIISLVGLLGVAVIPIMQKVFYNHMLQFLVALAVGALSGDALLHLLPHAISGGHGQGAHGKEQGEDHTGPVYKGLCGLIGIYFFYLIERVLTIFTEMKRRKKQYRNRKNKGDEEHDKVGVKLASDCDEVMMSVHPNKDDDDNDAADIFMAPAEALQGYADEAHSEHCMISFENTKALSHQHGTHKNGTHKHNDNDIEHEEEKVDMLSRSNSHGHGHSHAHGPTDSVAAIAWMVILGDGIHNFSDGLAIGAAFSNSITGGFSTSVAVFCHELPHEIGDFAMLLRAGMAPKQAIIYNCLSSVLCFIGMLIGVAIGNIENASLWIFAVVGGMFLYIALVDMLPEMSSVETKHGENPYSHLVLQMAGMLLGGGIMLVIALYEDRLKKVFD